MIHVFEEVERLKPLSLGISACEREIEPAFWAFFSGAWCWGGMGKMLEPRAEMHIPGDTYFRFEFEGRPSALELFWSRRRLCYSSTRGGIWDLVRRLVLVAPCTPRCRLIVASMELNT